MIIEYLKRATPPNETIDSATGQTVQRMIADIKPHGREAVERHARDLDGYSGKIVLDEPDFVAAAKAVPAGVRDAHCLRPPAAARPCATPARLTGRGRSRTDQRSDRRPEADSSQQRWPVLSVPGGRRRGGPGPRA